MRFAAGCLQRAGHLGRMTALVHRRLGLVVCPVRSVSKFAIKSSSALDSRSSNRSGTDRLLSRTHEQLQCWSGWGIHSARHISRIGAHDVGGDESLSDMPVPEEAPMQQWELEAHALMAALSSAGVFSTDQFRRAIEALPASAQAGWSYYEKWSSATATLLQEKGYLRPGELEAEILGDIASPRTSAPRFAKGDSVVVRTEEATRTGYRRPHLRTPGYIHGVAGQIERICGEFDDPSLLAYGLSGPKQFLYRVRFAQRAVWPEAESPHDTVDVDVYESWLLPAADGADTHGFTTEHYGTAVHEHEDAHGGSDDHGAEKDTSRVEGAIHSHHGDDLSDHAHVHLSRAEIEQNAISAEGAPRPGSAVHEALVNIVSAKGLVSREQLHQIGEKLELAECAPKPLYVNTRSLPAASLVARAWADPAFKARLLACATSAAAELNINAANPNAPTQLVVVENDAHTHNLVVCTLCSCYPASVLGPSPLWYKARSYRARAVRQPRKLLRDAFGLLVPDNIQLRVHDSTADMRYMVLPQRPAHTEHWSQEALRALITRNSLLGVSLPLKAATKA